MAVTSASYSFTMRLGIPQRPGGFAEVAARIGQAGGDIGAVDIARATRDRMWRDITVNATDSVHAQRIVDAIGELDDVIVSNVSDRTFLMHLGGKLTVEPTVQLATRDELSMAYTPGVARICRAIAEDTDKAWTLTVKRNTVAVVSDGTAVLGLGDIGPEAAMPVMEGKAALFKRFAGVDAWPICLNAHDSDEIVRIVEALAPGFGGINLEDISAPRCFEIERKLRERLDIPVFHDDQHGTAIVVLAALINALKVVGREMSDVRVLINGVGAAGTAIARMLNHAGVGDIICCDRQGAIHKGREGLDPAKQWIADNTNSESRAGSLDDVIEGAHVFVGVSVEGALPTSSAARMSSDAIICALANPVPELLPEDAPANVAVMATGRSDYPNQINNVLAFPGIFRGALDVRARAITPEMEHAAALAIARSIDEDHLSSEHIIPSVFNTDVVRNVAAAVASAARESGVARKEAPAPDVLSVPEGS